MNYLKYVNIKQGTKSISRFSNGNTLPLVQRPFGFAAFTPQTDSSRGRWFYHPDDHSFEGIRLTHQPSPWIGENCAMVMMPQSEEPYREGGRRWSSFDTEQTVLMPHYMRYYLNRPRATIELTPTEYGACVRLDFNNDFEKYLTIAPVGGMTKHFFDKEKNILFSSVDFRFLQGHDKGKTIGYFAFKFNDDIDLEATLVDVDNQKIAGTEVEGDGAAIHLALNKKQITYSMATSFISFEQAEQNLINDSNYDDFDSLKAQNEKIWNEHLSRIEIKAKEDKMRTFYSCMYRVFLYPHKAHEIDKEGNIVHYSPAADCVKPGYRYTENGFWDTYRTIYPLFSIIAKKEAREMIEGFVNDYIDGGWLPCWTAVDAKKCMPSTMIDTVIADAAVKGIIDGELLKTAFEGMEKHANNPSPIAAYGRDGCEDYLKYNYVPCDERRESVNLTLDAAYCDYCLGVVAEILGEDQKAQKYFARSKNYANIFDKETGFMRGKTKNGEFRPDFDPAKWGEDYTEAAAWQTSFAVQHDFEGLAELHGGRDKLIRKLDDFFACDQAFRVRGYGIEIHEMSEFAAGKWGQCAISNQPSFHIPFIYGYLGETKKTEYWVKRLCDEAFSAEDDGFPGDEDNGTTAAWYIFANIGKYPLCPGKNEYVEFKPLVKKIKFNV